MEEIFKTIKDYSNYKISNKGRVYSKKNNIYLRHWMGTDGYYRVTLSNSGSRKHYLLHRLIAENFIEIITYKVYINHVNGIKIDNRIENLEWCTASENQKHRFEKLNHKQDHLFKKVKQICTKTNITLSIWDSITEAARNNNAFKSGICMCCQGKIKTYVGYKWEYL